MRFEVLGPLRVVVGDETVPPGSPQQQKLLALLLVSPNRVVSTDRLIDELWGDTPPSTARHLVQDYVWRLRNLLGEADDLRIDREGSGYAVRVTPDEVDALRFAEAVDEAHQLRSHDVAAAERLLCDAIGMWRGKPYGDLSDECPSLQAEAVRLEELYLRAIADRVDDRMELGRYQDLIGELEALTELYPYRELFWEQLMLALYRSGRQAEALQTYQKLRRTIGEELGIEPGPSIQELEERILLHDPDLLWQPPPPLSFLPARLTSFVGRTKEITDVAKLLDTSRLVTLTGPGGIGKTRLGIEVGDLLLSRFPGGVWWIDLSALTDPDLVVAETARALGVSPQPETPLIESVVRSLAHREALLVIDNCEHLSSAVGHMVGSMLRGAARVRILATSRSPLHVSGEALWEVPALGMPLSSEMSVAYVLLSDAVRLFVERGAEVESAFRLTADNTDAVMDVCRRLDGMPLAIEMAAARLRVLSPSQIGSSLSDRFALLTRWESGAVPRHETLEAVVDWSYDLLEPSVQFVFERLSIFAGAFDLEAADAVGCGNTEEPSILDALTELVDASMVATVSGEATVRYRLLETLREYGLRRLEARGNADESREAHANYFLRLTVQAEETIGTPDFASWMSRLGDSYDDLRQALEWSLARHPRARTLRCAPTLFQFWFRTGDAREAGWWGNRMLRDDADVPGPLVGAAHLSASFSAAILGTSADAQTHIEEAIRLYRESGDQRGLVTALFGKGNVALRIGDFDTARECSHEALALCDETSDRWGRAGPLSMLSFAHFFGGGSLDEARRLSEEALMLYEELGDTGSQVVMNPLSAIALRQGDFDAAERFAVDAAAIGAGTGWEATALVNLAEVLLAKGQGEEAEATLRRGLVRALDAGLENWFRIALRDLAQIAVLSHKPQRAARLMGASRRNMPQYGLDRTIYESVEGECRKTLDEQLIARCTEEGYQATHEQLLNMVLHS